jgi:hypothetical protein
VSISIPLFLQPQAHSITARCSFPSLFDIITLSTTYTNLIGSIPLCCIIQYYNCPSINTTIILKITMLFIKYGYMYRLLLNHPQANMITEFRYIKFAPIRTFLYLIFLWWLYNFNRRAVIIFVLHTQPIIVFILIRQYIIWLSYCSMTLYKVYSSNIS